MRPLKTAPREGRHPSPAAAETAPAAPALDLGPLPELLGYALRRVQLLVFQDFIERMAEFDIRPAQYSVLTVIGANPGLKQTHIGTALGIKQANLVAAIDELERRGLAKRIVTATDRRSYAVHLTEAGEKLLERLNALVLEHERRVTSRIGAAGKRRLLDLLAEIGQSLS
jgi:DNA-binding MarR family transcriptional regulator